MRTYLLPLLIFISVQVFAQTKTQRRLESLERERFEAMTKKDAAFLQNVLDVDLTYTHSNGLVENKARHLENILAGTIVYRSMQPEAMDIKVFKKTAVINGFVNVGGTYKDTEFDIRLRYMDVYIKKRGKWKLAAWQSVKVD